MGRNLFRCIMTTRNRASWKFIAPNISCTDGTGWWWWCTSHNASDVPEYCKCCRSEETFSIVIPWSHFTRSWIEEWDLTPRLWYHDRVNKHYRNAEHTKCRENKCDQHLFQFKRSYNGDMHQLQLTSDYFRSIWIMQVSIWEWSKKKIKEALITVASLSSTIWSHKMFIRII